MSFDIDRKGTGTAEWAEVTVNIQIGCVNNCIYCYAAHKASTMYGGWCKRDEWSTERLTKRAAMRSYPAREGVVMFPSTHDITPFNVEEYIRVAKVILSKGNRLLIVSKPRLGCIRRLLYELTPFKNQILLRFTIGSIHPDATSFWEPGAPSPDERIACLQLARAFDFNTSISIEPMLGGINSAIDVVRATRNYVTDTFWIGKMNKVRLRVDMSNPVYAEQVELIEELQCDDAIISLYDYFKADPMIRWKDSIKEVVSRHFKPEKE